MSISSGPVETGLGSLGWPLDGSMEFPMERGAESNGILFDVVSQTAADRGGELRRWRLLDQRQPALVDVEIEDLLGLGLPLRQDGIPPPA